MRKTKSYRFFCGMLQIFREIIGKYIYSEPAWRHVNAQNAYNQIQYRTRFTEEMNVKNEAEIRELQKKKINRQ